MAIVSGRLQIRPYTDKDGNKRTAAEVVAENLYFGDSKREDRPQQYEEITEDDPDLPF
nr:MAG TPA: hypothetical protein [Caudoviricetes sp.]